MSRCCRRVAADSRMRKAIDRNLLMASKVTQDTDTALTAGLSCVIDQP